MAVTKDPAQSVSSGVTLDTVVDRVRDELDDRVIINVLNAAVTNSATQFEFKYAFGNNTAVASGSLVSIGDEVVYVLSVEGKTITVLRGHQNTTAASHSQDEKAYFGPVTRKQIVNAVNSTIDSLYPNGLYQMRTVPISGYSWGVFAYPLSDINGSDVYDVQYLVPGTTDEYRHLSGWTVNSIDNTLLFNSAPFATDLRVVYRSPFAHLTNGTDDVQSVGGIHDEAVDVLVYGACQLLTASEEYKRNDFRSQGDTRRPQEVPTGSMTRSHMVFKELYQNRLSDERDRLRKRYPVRRAGW